MEYPCKVLAEIKEADIGIESAEEILGKKFKLRKSARGVILNSDNEVSIQFVSKSNYYKLPGGGVEHGESIEEALRREILEEVGCNIKIQKEIGLTIEYRSKLELIHISYGFIAKVDGEIGQPSYDQGEIGAGFQPIWMSIDEAIKKTSSLPDAYEGKFIIKRESIFLAEAKRLLYP